MKHILVLVSILCSIFLTACGGSNGSKTPPVVPPPALNPTVTVTSYESESVIQQESVSINVLKLVTSDINTPKITKVSFNVEVTGGYQDFTFDTNNITINGNPASQTTDNTLVFEGDFQSFSNNESILNIDILLESFKGFGGTIILTEIQNTVIDSANNEYLSEKSSFTLNIAKNVDFSTVEFIEHNSVVTQKTLIAQVKAGSDIALCDGTYEIYFGEYNSNLAGSMYDSTTPENILPKMNQADLSMIESLTIVNNLTKEESTFPGSENLVMLGVPIATISQDNRLDFSIYATKIQGASLENVGIIQNLKGFGDCNNSNGLHQNRWKYHETPISFYDSYLEMKRMTQDQSGIVQDQVEKKIEDYILNVLKCETCLGTVILNNIVYKYNSINVDVSTSSIKFLIDGLPTYNGVISINENDKLVFTPETELTGESNLEVSVIMNVLDVDQTAKFGIYPETYTFFIVETGETITLDYEPGQPYSE